MSDFVFFFSEPDDMLKNDDVFLSEGNLLTQDFIDDYIDYYINLQGMPFRDVDLLRCHYCSAPIEAYGGKLERAYVWFSVHEEDMYLLCHGLVCKRCAERMVFPVKPYPTNPEEEHHIRCILIPSPNIKPRAL